MYFAIVRQLFQQVFLAEKQMFTDASVRAAVELLSPCPSATTAVEYVEIFV
jgi:hypothetical protein